MNYLTCKITGFDPAQIIIEEISMMGDGLKKIIKNKSRYFLVGAVLAMTIMINSSDITTPQNQVMVCSNDTTSEFGPAISRNQNTYRVDNVFESNQGDFYRLSFWRKADDDVKLSINVSGISNEQKIISTLDIAGDWNYRYEEVIFFTSGRYTDITFVKEQPENQSLIFINNLSLSRLNIHSDQEIGNLQPTIVGLETVYANPSQVDESNHQFHQLASHNTMLGQIFKAETDFMTSFTIKLRMVGNGGSGKYKIDIREVSDKNMDKPSIKKTKLAELSFTVCDLEKYQVEEDLYYFPISAPLEKGQYYYIGFENQKVAVDNLDYLTVLGTSAEDGYEEGYAVSKKEGNATRLSGDFFFEIGGGNHRWQNDGYVAVNTKIEDLGGGKGIFRYKEKPHPQNIINLAERSKDIGFHQEEKVIFGYVQKKSSYQYHFNTVYPLQQVRIKAKQPDIDWQPAILSYSFDGKKWSDVVFRDNGEIRLYDIIIDTSGQDEIFLKVTPSEVMEDKADIHSEDGENQTEDKPYGIKDLTVTGSLIMQQ